MAGRTGAAFRPWTQERADLVRKLVADGVSRKESLPILNALPGPTLSRSSLDNHLHAHGLKLSADARRAVFQRSGSSKALNKGAPPRMTPERLAYLAEAFPRGDEVEDIWPILNAMPGPPIKSPRALYEHAKNHGLRRPSAGHVSLTPEEAKERVRVRQLAYDQRRQAARADRLTSPIMLPRRRIEPVVVIAEPAPVMEATPERADAVTNERYAKVKAALARKGDPFAIHVAHRMPLREVYRVAMELRREMAA